MQKGTRPHILVIYAILSVYVGFVANSFSNSFSLIGSKSFDVNNAVVDSLMLMNVNFSLNSVVGLSVGIACVWLVWCYVYLVPRPERTGEEHGSAKLGDLKFAKNFASVGDDNITISKNIKLGFGKSVVKDKVKAREFERNKNIFLLGDSGSGKTRYFITPNVMNMNTDMVITDPKGGVLAQCGHMLEAHGVRIKSFNTFDPSKSCHYNPLRYLRSDIDVLEFAEFMTKNFKRSAAGKSDDPFWDNASNKLYSALIPYLRDWGNEEDYNLPCMVHLLRLAKVDEADSNFRSALDILFDQLRYGVQETTKKKTPNRKEVDGIEFAVDDNDELDIVNEELSLIHKVVDKQGNVIQQVNPFLIYLELNFGEEADKRIRQNQISYFALEGKTFEDSDENREIWRKYLSTKIRSPRTSLEGDYRFIIMSSIAEEKGYPSAKDDPNIKPVFDDNAQAEVPVYDEQGLPVYEFDEYGRRRLKTETYIDFALGNFHDFKLAPAKTISSILECAIVNLTAVTTKELAEILSYDELEIERLGENSPHITALFVICKDVDKTLSFLTGMLLWQTMNVLSYKALSYKGEHLRRPVQIMLDEFVNDGYFANIEQFVAVVRSRWIFLYFIVQNIGQVDALYSKDTRQTIWNNCATHLILGVNDKDTAKDLSEGFGNATIHTRNFNRTRGNNGSTSENNNSSGRAVFYLDEIKRMNARKCIVEIAHTDPFIDDKFDITKHKNYNELDDGQETYIYADKGAFNYCAYRDNYRETWKRERMAWCSLHQGEPTAEVVDIRKLPYVNNSWIES